MPDSDELVPGQDEAFADFDEDDFDYEFDDDFEEETQEELDEAAAAHEGDFSNPQSFSGDANCGADESEESEGEE